jgi:hypothetical protein
MNSTLTNSHTCLSETSVYMTLSFFYNFHSLQHSSSSLETHKMVKQPFHAGPTSEKSSALSKLHTDILLLIWLPVSLPQYCNFLYKQLLPLLRISTNPSVTTQRLTCNINTFLHIFHVLGQQIIHDYYHNMALRYIIFQCLVAANSHHLNQDALNSIVITLAIF